MNDDTYYCIASTGISKKRRPVALDAGAITGIVSHVQGAVQAPFEIVPLGGIVNTRTALLFLAFIMLAGLGVSASPVPHGGGNRIEDIVTCTPPYTRDSLVQSNMCVPGGSRFQACAFDEDGQAFAAIYIPRFLGPGADPAEENGTLLLPGFMVTETLHGSGLKRDDIIIYYTSRRPRATYQALSLPEFFGRLPDSYGMRLEVLRYATGRRIFVEVSAARLAALQARFAGVVMCPPDSTRIKPLDVGFVSYPEGFNSFYDLSDPLAMSYLYWDKQERTFLPVPVE